MKNSYGIVKHLLRTEKSGEQLLPLNKYCFSVDMNANKIDVKKAIEEIYKVKVNNVNIIIVSGKKRRVRYQEGKTSDWKKAIVSLKEGHKIDIT